jgi:hypothetical protein
MLLLNVLEHTNTLPLLFSFGENMTFRYKIHAFSGKTILEKAYSTGNFTIFSEKNMTVGKGF